MLNRGELLGNSRALNLISNYLETDLKSKVFLFYGGVGVGKKTFAKAFAHALLKKVSNDKDGKKLSSGNHPDMHEYYPDSKSGFHTIESMRGLIKEVVLPPLESSKKVFIVYKLDKAQEVSIQALLKTLEEPTDDTIIILVADGLDHIHDTVISRCIKIPFFPLSQEEIATALQKRLEISEEKALHRAKLAMGSLKRAMLIDEKTTVLLSQELEGLLIDVESKSLHEIMIFIEKVMQHCFDKDSIYSPDDLLEMIYNFYRDLSFANLGATSSFPWSKPLKKHIDIDLEMLQRLIVDVKEKLAAFIKPKSVLLNFLLQIQSLIGQAQKVK